MLEEELKIVKEFAEVIFKNGLDSFCETKDLVLAEYVLNCIKAFQRAKDDEERLHEEE